jgi:hypothetical protein
LSFSGLLPEAALKFRGGFFSGATQAFDKKMPLGQMK